MSGTLYVIVCGAGAAADAGVLVTAAVERGWDVYAVPTPAGAEFIDGAALEELTGHPVRSRYRRPGEEGKLPPADAVIVAPGTYNTINKWSFGTSDTFALGLLAEMTGLGVPIALVPFVNTSLAANRVYQESLHRLETSGVIVLTDNADNAPHPPGTGDDAKARFPWTAALDAVTPM
jgi:phosphopantothenoylcysteine synthetase/decarboxylase